MVKKENVSQHEHEEALRIAGIKAAHFIGKAAREYEDYEEEVFQWKSLAEKLEEYPDLPKVAYVYQWVGQGLLHDTYF